MTQSVDIENSISCYDFGSGIDRYTVVFDCLSERNRLYYIGMSYNPYHPLGFGQYGEGKKESAYFGKRISFADLPDDCRRLVKEELSDIENQKIKECL